MTITWSRMCYHRSVSCYVYRPGNICLSRRPEGTNGLFLTIAYKPLIIHWLKNVNDSVRMPPALYKFGHTSQYVMEQIMERRERLWNPSQLYWLSEKPDPVCLPRLLFISQAWNTARHEEDRLVTYISYWKWRSDARVKKPPFRKKHHASRIYDCGVYGNQGLRQDMDLNHRLKFCSRHKLLLISTKTGLVLHSLQQLIHLLIRSQTYHSSTFWSVKVVQIIQKSHLHGYTVHQWYQTFFSPTNAHVEFIKTN